MPVTDSTAGKPDGARGTSESVESISILLSKAALAGLVTALWRRKARLPLRVSCWLKADAAGLCSTCCQAPPPYRYPLRERVGKRTRPRQPRHPRRARLPVDGHLCESNGRLCRYDAIPVNNGDAELFLSA
jgi:hypothetical protein